MTSKFYGFAISNTIHPALIVQRGIVSHEIFKPRKIMTRYESCVGAPMISTLKRPRSDRGRLFITWSRF